MLRIGSLLKDVSTRPRVSLPMQALVVRAAAKEAIRRAYSNIPEDVFKKVKPTTFKNGVLTVIAPRLLRVDLQMRSGGLVSAINSAIGKRLVRDLRLRNS